MKAGKRGAPAPRPRSGWVSEDDRKTERITLRLDPETMTRLRSFATEHGWTVAQTVAEAFKALDRELKADFEEGRGHMTKEEREKILMAVSFADGGCPSCVRGLIQRLSLLFPDEPFANEFGPVDTSLDRWKRKMHRREWADLGKTPEEIAEEDALLYGVSEVTPSPQRGTP